MSLGERMRRDRASQRQRDIEALLDLAGHAELAARFLASDASLSDMLQELLRLRTLDQVVHEGPGAVLRN